MAYRNPGPRLSGTVQYTAEQQLFLDSIKPWTKDHWAGKFELPDPKRSIRELKDKIKSDLATIQNNYCAFCGLDLELAYETHREHVAPQYKHPHFIFEPRNLVLTCNFCNMEKGKKLTVTVDTEDYDTTTFKILHPHRDDFCHYLSCDFANNELIFTILDHEGGKAQKTIDFVGLAEPHLVKQRGAIIMQATLPNSAANDALVKQIAATTRRGI